MTKATPEEKAETRLLLRHFGGEVVYLGHGIVFNQVDTEGHSTPVSLNSDQWNFVQPLLKELVELRRRINE